ncbi:fasciclin domain-containing protein [Dyadobacter sp. 22481]
MKKNRFGGRWAAFFLAAGLFSTILISCKEDEADKVKQRAMTDIILETPEFSMLKDVMLYAEMSDAFRTQNVTFFAPDNDAFRKANILSSSAITSMEKDSVKTFLKNHMIAGPITYSGFTKSETKEAITKRKISIEVESNVVTVNKSDIVKKDVFASNGMIQVIDSVIVNVKK